MVFLDHRRQRSFEVHGGIAFGACGLHGIAKHLRAALASAMSGLGGRLRRFFEIDDGAQRGFEPLTHALRNRRSLN